MSAAYSAKRTAIGGIEVVRLTDAARQTEVAIAIGAGNMAYEFKVRGENFLWFPFADPAGLLEHPRFCGIPFLAPWANRIDGDSYWVNGRQHHLNPEIRNFRRDSFGNPIHGLVNYSRDWTL